MIILRDIEHSFGAFRLGPISTRFDTGGYWVVLGPSGCGKSMLLHCLAGLFEPDRGGIEIHGDDVTASPPEARNIGMVFQEPALFPHMSVTDNVAYGLRARGQPSAKRAQRVAEIIERFALEPLLARPTATLSGGEARKVALARTLATEPRVLLLDEPLGPLDHNARIDLQGELRRIHQGSGLTTLHVTHSREEARALSSHCAVMFGGRIIQAGATDAVFNAARCIFVAMFLGTKAPADQNHPACTKRCVIRGDRCDAPQWPQPR